MLVDFLTKYVKISYEIVPVFFVSIIVSFMHIRTWSKGRKTTIYFRYLVYGVLFWNLNEVLAPVVLESGLSGPVGDYIRILVDSTQFFWGHLTLFFFVMYLEQYTKNDEKKIMRQINTMIIIWTTAVVITNPATHWMFTYYGIKEGYEKGPLYFAAGYLPALIFGIYAVNLYLKNFKEFALREKVGLFSTVAMIFLGAAIQPTLNGQLKVTGLFAAYGLFILYLSLETSDYLNLMETKGRLVEAEELASSASRAKSTFIANMSHEIRTPMNAILGINEMILKESNEEKTLSYARDMKISGESLLTIINDVLDISKMEAGKLEIRDEVYNFADLIDELSYEAKTAANEKHLEFELRLDEKLPNQLMGDKEHLKQVFHNVLDNAVKYTKRGRIIFEINGQVEGEFVYLAGRVLDTGVGIKEEDIDSLFQNFHRVDLERNRSIEGTGLGLSLCKQILTLMGGRISVISEYEKGSIFTVEIAQKVVSEETILEYRESHEAFNPMTRKIEEVVGKKFLVVDDNEMNLKVASAFLEPSGAQIVVKQDSVEAFELIQKEKFDLIFLDDLMPRLTGSAIMTRSKRSANGINKETPFIIMTANSSAKEEEEYLELGFDGYVAKPMKEEKLVEVVNKFVK